jgi:hypothetical protein
MSNYKKKTIEKKPKGQNYKVKWQIKIANIP